MPAVKKPKKRKSFPALISSVKGRPLRKKGSWRAVISPGRPPGYFKDALTAEDVRRDNEIAQAVAKMNARPGLVLRVPLINQDEDDRFLHGSDDIFKFGPSY